MGNETNIIPLKTKWQGGNPPVGPGDEVLDIGCKITQATRSRNPLDVPKIPCKVVRVFNGGLRVCNRYNPEDEWDCEYWENEWDCEGWENET